MSFDEIEISLDDGKPALLLEFSRTGRVWRYTNMEEDITIEGDVYLSIPFTSSDITQSGESSNDTVNFELPSTCEFSQYIDARSPTEDIGIKLRKLHMVGQPNGDFTPPELYEDAPICWVGTYGLAKRPAINRRVVVGNTISLSMSRGGLRLAWQRACHHFLYQRGCWVNKEDYAAPLTGVTIVDGLTLTSLDTGNYPDGWFNGGMIEWESEPGIKEIRGIEFGSTNALIIFGGTDGMEGGSNFVAYPGCNHTPNHCTNKFNNRLNYGGIDFLQGRSLFDGNPVF